MWDIRSAHSVKTIWGPYICGDALDMCVDDILTGSWVADDALQVRVAQRKNVMEHKNYSLKCFSYTDLFLFG